ncbi:hypothetical protein [Acinetobacter sp. WCHAc010052]|uniref:hypothetical protein n=1 Tax=Acinetobacter sp. WCHAc010052 TaxID=2004647 RepID=UPI000B3C405E|nr:hypothetical protein [Acinetobacter sp. WCHAc010052]AXY61109.1 hypothetical protein CDG61_14465 [Acinetobacter sp. WCHAc010052]
MQINRNIIDEKFHENLDTLASISHEIWAHWQKYLHDQCEIMPDGSFKIPSTLVAKWTEQINLNYDELTPQEKKSDIEQALKFKSVFCKMMNEILEDKSA